MRARRLVAGVHLGLSRFKHKVALVRVAALEGVVTNPKFLRLASLALAIGTAGLSFTLPAFASSQSYSQELIEAKANTREQQALAEVNNRFVAIIIEKSNLGSSKQRAALKEIRRLQLVNAGSATEIKALKAREVELEREILETSQLANFSIASLQSETRGVVADDDMALSIIDSFYAGDKSAPQALIDHGSKRASRISQRGGDANRHAAGILMAEYLNAAAMLYAANADFAAMKQTLMRASEADPSSEAAGINLAFADLITGEIQKGMEVLRTLSQVSTDDSVRTRALYFLVGLEIGAVEATTANADGQALLEVAQRNARAYPDNYDNALIYAQAQMLAPLPQYLTHNELPYRGVPGRLQSAKNIIEMGAAGFEKLISQNPKRAFLRQLYIFHLSVVADFFLDQIAPSFKDYDASDALGEHAAFSYAIEMYARARDVSKAQLATDPGNVRYITGATSASIALCRAELHLVDPQRALNDCGEAKEMMSRAFGSNQNDSLTLLVYSDSLLAYANAAGNAGKDEVKAATVERALALFKSISSDIARVSIVKAQHLYVLGFAGSFYSEVNDPRGANAYDQAYKIITGADYDRTDMVLVVAGQSVLHDYFKLLSDNNNLSPRILSIADEDLALQRLFLGGANHDYQAVKYYIEELFDVGDIRRKNNDPMGALQMYREAADRTNKWKKENTDDGSLESLQWRALGKIAETTDLPADWAQAAIVGRSLKSRDLLSKQEKTIYEKQVRKSSVGGVR